jgi:YjbE family integral membrane protein
MLLFGSRSIMEFNQLDLGIFGSIHFNLRFLTDLLSIVLIDLILAGDNAVVIALAVRSLPPAERKKGIFYGAGAAVLLRVIVTFFVAHLLEISYVKLIGGAVIIWIAVKLFVEGAPAEHAKREAKSLTEAVKIVVIADITMSIDNMLAVAGASRGNVFLLVLGLGLSIPFVLFTSNLLSMLMDRYPIIVYIGAAVLGRVGGGMMITDPVVVNLINPSDFLQYGTEAFFAVGVLVAGRLLLQRARRAAPQQSLRSQSDDPTDSKKTG